VSAPKPPPGPLPNNCKVKAQCVAGLRKGKTYGILEGVNYIGRMGPTEVHLDLTEQENPGIPVKVNRFALVWFDKNGLGIADTGTRIGTFVNGAKIASGKRIPLKGGDKLKFGKVELEIKIIAKKQTGVQK